MKNLKKAKLESIHLLGVGGTLMGNLAILLQKAGYSVSGADKALYPPMSDLLHDSGISMGPDDFLPEADLYIIGNALTRGHPCVEKILDEGRAFTSAPDALRQLVLSGTEVTAVSGTHGKTTTTAMLAHIFSCAEAADGKSGGQDWENGWLIAGQPSTPKDAARLGSKRFALEADEYDTAFFDKSAKFLHYFPKYLAITSLEHDHADIYPDLESIVAQFHRLLRQLPGNGALIVPWKESVIEELLERGVWTAIKRFATLSVDDAQAAKTHSGEAGKPDYLAEPLSADWHGFQLSRLQDGIYEDLGKAHWRLRGEHNVRNALVAVALAEAQGIDGTRSLRWLEEFDVVRRRQESLGVSGGVHLYDDFAHHPTAVQATLKALQPEEGRLIAVLEMRSNSMQLGLHDSTLPQALATAEQAWIWSSDSRRRARLERGRTLDAPPLNTITDLADEVCRELKAGDHLVLMSNGSFQGLAETLKERLQRDD